MLELIAFLLLLGVSAAAAVTDWRSQKVYNRLTYPAMLSGLVLWTVAGFAGWIEPANSGVTSPSGIEGAWWGLTQSGLALAAGLIPFSILFLMGALGGGDAKLMGAVGALSASWECVFQTALLAFIISMLFGIAVMIKHGLVKRTLNRVLVMALGALAKSKAAEAKDSPKIPFSVGIAIGAGIAGLQHLLGVGLPLVHG